jgi:hypothetical protein
MALILEFKNSLDQHGYFIVKGDKLRIRFVSDGGTEEACFVSQKKRDQFVKEITEYVDEHLTSPLMLGREVSTGLCLDKKSYDITMEFKEDVNYLTLWHFLIKIPQEILETYIADSSVFDMLGKAKEYFIDCIDDNDVKEESCLSENAAAMLREYTCLTDQDELDERVELEEKQNAIPSRNNQSGLFFFNAKEQEQTLSDNNSSSRVFFFNDGSDVTDYQASRLEATEKLKKIMEEDAKVRALFGK